MPSKKRVLEERERAYLATLANRHHAKKTIQEYGRIIRKANAELEVAGLTTNPRLVDDVGINHLMATTFGTKVAKNMGEKLSMDPKTARWSLAIYSAYLAHYGNHVVRDMHIPWPRGKRLHADWLNERDAVKVIAHAIGVERLIIHLELQLGLRRVEVIRLRVQDIEDDLLHIQGKGRQGGKPRTMPFHQDTYAELRAYLDLRREVIAKARSKNPSVTVPEALFIYEKNGRLFAYQKSAVDNMVKRVAEKSGLKFSNHTLRRTFGRMAWRAKVPLETISKMLGHEDTRMTIEYLGLNLDDMQDGMKMMCQYQNALKSGNSACGQEM